MANNATYLTITGNLTRDPEMAYTTSGVARTRLAIAVTPRRFDKNAGEWTDGETTYWECTLWRGLAENAAESLRKGARVIATGTVTTQRWDDKETGEPRSRVVLDLEDIGPSLTWATASVSKATRSRASGPARDQWSSEPPAQDEPPF
ncbi:single-stranded DNA-binding protein [Yinghuangia seranimata]|uniref:single-stranded DNA-binding protein n=1 Tax=Yinghuangia seranimata TaxID=408067 RepID=UPI00248B8488|nr:single-stranded DNA-binding protein [Yinghuangia seranimata]MDI2126949.1 single-stranded DNA-binding protein [Yinghuangia seranimata]